MYITGKGRYDNYTSRYDVYLFTLRDYTEDLLDKFNGQYVERSDMPIHSGYLLEFVDYNAAKEFITSISTSNSTSDFITTYELPHLEGNELALYATTAEDINIIYIGLSEYKDALNKYIGSKVSLSFDANGGTGTITSINKLEGSVVTIPDSTGLTAPSSKKFDSWNTMTDGSGTKYESGDTITLDKSIKLFAQWVSA